MTKRILHVVSNVAHYADPSEPTGLWLAELTHAYRVFASKGYEQCLVSPKGGVSPLEPRSLKWPHADSTAKAWLADKARLALLSTTARPDEVDPADFDAIYFTGGHAVMWDFPDDAGPVLQILGMTVRPDFALAVRHFPFHDRRPKGRFVRDGLIARRLLDCRHLGGSRISGCKVGGTYTRFRVRVSAPQPPARPDRRRRD